MQKRGSSETERILQVVCSALEKHPHSNVACLVMFGVSSAFAS